jgi:PAS domain S-box-containing protein
MGRLETALEEARATEAETASWSSGTGESADRLRAHGPNADAIRALAGTSSLLGPLSTWDDVLVSTLNLILTSRFPMFLTWGPTHLLFHNDAFETVLVGKGPCQGRDFHSVFPEAGSKLEPLLERAREGEASYFEDLEVPLLRNSVLTDTWWSFSYSPLFTDAGERAGVFGVVYETTRRFLAEQALWSSEAALRAITDMAPAMLWRCDAEDRITWVNQRLQTYLGHARLGGVRLQDYFHPDDQARAVEVLESCSRASSPFEAQVRLRDRNASYRWFLIRAQQVWDSEGRLGGWCGSAVDIEDWRNAADGLTDRDERFREFSGAESTLMWTADVATRHAVGLNPQFRSAWALPLTGEPVPWDAWVASVHPDDRPQMAGAFDRVAAGETLQGKFRSETPGGGLRWFHATAFPIPGPDGSVARIGGLLVDVTGDVDPRVYLIHADAAGQNRLSHAFTRAGFKVRSFDDAAAFAKMSDDLMAGVVVLAADDDVSSLIGGAGVLGLNGSRFPWIAVGEFDHHMNEIVQLMKLGAANVLPSGADPEVLISAVRAAMPSSPRKQDAPRAPSSDARQRIAELSRREREVLDGLAAGGTNKTIAQSLSLSPRTVETYRAQLMDRLGVRTLAELLRLAAEARG